MFAIVYILIVCFISGITESSTHEYRRECNIWKQEISRIKQTEPRVDVMCKVNSQCTGFDCKGKYTYNGFYTAYQTYSKSLCFGLWISPCTTPQKLTVYIEQRSDNISYMYSTGDDGTKEEDIPGVEETIDLSIVKVKAKVTVETYVKHLQKQNKPFMVIGLKIKPKVIYNSNPEYPSDMQVVLVKNVEVPVPACDRSVPKTTHKAHTCPDITKDNQVLPERTTPPLNEPCRKDQLHLCDKTYRCYCVNSNNTKSCNQVVDNTAVFGECGNNQGCIFQDRKSKKIYCGCRPEYHMEGARGYCVPDIPTTTSTFVINYDDSADHSIMSSKKNVIIIASCSAGAIILAFVATSFVVWRYVKHRARYSNHSLLRNQDDDFENDVPPIDLET